MKWILLCSLVLIVSTLVDSTKPQKALAYDRFSNVKELNNESHDTIIILGATSDKAKQYIYPALWSLFLDDLFYDNTKIIGYAKESLSIEDLRKTIEPFVEIRHNETELFKKFWDMNGYHAAPADKNFHYTKLGSIIDEIENGEEGNRIFYFALLPDELLNAVSQIKQTCMSKTGWNRIVIENEPSPSKELIHYLEEHFEQSEIYILDRYLGDEMLRNFMTLRFANTLLSQDLNKRHVGAVKIDFKSSLGVESRGPGFDDYGIIKDVMQTHLVQLMSIITMPRPTSFSDIVEIRDLRTKMIENIYPASFEDITLGQYIGNPDSEDPRERIGYRENPTIPYDSITPTFATAVVSTTFSDWQRIPFIFRAGLGLHTNQTEITFLFEKVPDIYGEENKLNSNKLIIRLGENGGIEAKIMAKVPGLGKKNEVQVEEITLNYNYGQKDEHHRVIDAYKLLISDVLIGNQVNCIRTHEVEASWGVFKSALREIHVKKVRPFEYKFGSTGPVVADEKERKLLASLGIS